MSNNQPPAVDSARRQQHGWLTGVGPFGVSARTKSDSPYCCCLFELMVLFVREIDILIEFETRSEQQ